CVIGYESVRYFLKNSRTADSSGQPPFAPELCEHCGGLLGLVEREEILRLGVSTEQNLAEILSNRHAVNHTGIAVQQEILRWKSNIGQPIPELAHQRIDPFPKDAVHLPALASARNKGFQIVDVCAAELV